MSIPVCQYCLPDGITNNQLAFVDFTDFWQLPQLHWQFSSLKHLDYVQLPKDQFCKSQQTTDLKFEKLLGFLIISPWYNIPFAWINTYCLRTRTLDGSKWLLFWIFNNSFWLFDYSFWLFDYRVKYSKFLLTVET